jgi:dolichol-phosphate mannosyltransferase
MNSIKIIIPALLRRVNSGSGAEVIRFCLVGASGYVVNLAVYSGLMHMGLHYLPAAAMAFAVAFANNYTCNRRWTFKSQRGNVYDQGARYLVISLCTLGGNLLLLHWLISLHADKLVAQAVAVIFMTPLNFLGSKLWAFARPQPRAAA